MSTKRSGLDSSDSDYIDLPTPPASASLSPNKKSKPSPNKPKRVIQKWTPQEDAVLAELIDLALKTNIWEIVKDDGRLVYRGSNGVKKHVASLVKRLRK